MTFLLRDRWCPPYSSPNVTNCSAATFGNAKWLCGDQNKHGSCLLSLMLEFELLRQGYLKCVRCLWMSRSRMGVGLEEPKGDRS